MIHQFPQRELIYCAKDIPMFHYFLFPQLAAFKMYFWMKVYHQYPQYDGVNFDLKVVPAELMSIGERILKTYSELPSVEIWSDEIANITSRQVEYALESGYISQSQFDSLLDDCRGIMERLKKFAANGSKNGKEQNYSLYKNDILIADTTLLFKMGEKRVTFLTYNTMNILTTSEETFCSIIEDYLKNLVNKSVLISSTGERERNKFFNRIGENINAFKK